MEIDKKIIKALSSDTRLDILKSLADRRKMPSELSKELNLAPSTIIEHLNKLEDVGLIVRKESGRKWIYYELTNKGESLIKPSFPVQFVLMLSLGIILTFSGIIKYFYFVPVQFVPTMTVEKTVTGGTPSVVQPIDWLAIFLLIIGIILILISLIRQRK